MIKRKPLFFILLSLLLNHLYAQNEDVDGFRRFCNLSG